MKNSLLLATTALFLMCGALAAENEKLKIELFLSKFNIEKQYQGMNPEVEFVGEIKNESERDIMVNNAVWIEYADEQEYNKKHGLKEREIPAGALPKSDETVLYLRVKCLNRISPKEPNDVIILREFAPKMILNKGKTIFFKGVVMVACEATGLQLEVRKDGKTLAFSAMKDIAVAGDKDPLVANWAQFLRIGDDFCLKKELSRGEWLLVLKSFPRRLNIYGNIMNWLRRWPHDADILLGLQKYLDETNMLPQLKNVTVIRDGDNIRINWLKPKQDAYDRILVYTKKNDWFYEGAEDINVSSSADSVEIKAKNGLVLYGVKDGVYSLPAIIEIPPPDVPINPDKKPE